MKSKKKQQLIISLIKDDLVNSKLVSTLDDIGLNAAHYYLHLSSTIFSLMGYKDDSYNDMVFQQYRALAANCKYVDISEGNSTLDPLAFDLYKLLLRKAP